MVSEREDLKGWHRRGYLPHFDGGEIPQFVTFRLADSLPRKVLVAWREELGTRPSPKKMQDRIEAYLDAGRGDTWLSDPRLAKIVEDALTRFDGERYRLHAWVIMPTHVHVLLTPQRDARVPDIVHSWKSFTAKEANRILGRSGPFWHEDYFDRFIRDEHHYEATVEYIKQNPVKAGLCHNPEDWPFLKPSTPGPPLGPRASRPQNEQEHSPGPPTETTATDLSDLRQEYKRTGLFESDADRNPIEQFRRWFDEALAANLHEPNAMTVATATPDGKPSARVVLLKGFDERGFVFYTNYGGRKGRELEDNPGVALLFYWGELERQVRIEGQASRVPDSESDAYYASRPRGSRLGAWASRQSRTVGGREELEDRLRALEEEYEGREIPRPPFWGGYRVEPEAIEFWQGRENRLHDRLVYSRAEGGWKTERLQP